MCTCSVLQACVVSGGAVSGHGNSCTCQSLLSMIMLCFFCLWPQTTHAFSCNAPSSCGTVGLTMPSQVFMPCPHLYSGAVCALQVALSVGKATNGIRLQRQTRAIPFFVSVMRAQFPVGTRHIIPSICSACRRRRGSARRCTPSCSGARRASAAGSALPWCTWAT